MNKKENKLSTLLFCLSVLHIISLCVFLCMLFLGGCSLGHDAPPLNPPNNPNPFSNPTAVPTENPPQLDCLPEEGDITTDISEINPDDYFNVLLVGSREMTVYDMTSPEYISVYTYDLDDLPYGTWYEADTFRICWYETHQYGTTSPENWYLIQLLGDSKVYLDTYNAYDVTYEHIHYPQNENHKIRFILSKDGVSYDDGSFFDKVEELNKTEE